MEQRGRYIYKWFIWCSLSIFALSFFGCSPPIEDTPSLPPFDSPEFIHCDKGFYLLAHEKSFFQSTLCRTEDKHSKNNILRFDFVFQWFISKKFPRKVIIVNGNQASTTINEWNYRANRLAKEKIAKKVITRTLNRKDDMIVWDPPSYAVFRGDPLDIWLLLGVVHYERTSGDKTPHGLFMYQFTKQGRWEQLKGIASPFYFPLFIVGWLMLWGLIILHRNVNNNIRLEYSHKLLNKSIIMSSPFVFIVLLLGLIILSCTVVLDRYLETSYSNAPNLTIIGECFKLVGSFLIVDPFVLHRKRKNMQYNMIFIGIIFYLVGFVFWFFYAASNPGGLGA